MAVTQKTGHIDKPLSNLAVAAFDGVASNIADQIAPVVPVAHRTDKYYTFTKNSWLRIPDTLRAPKSPSNRVEWDIASDSYSCKDYGLAAEWPVEDEANADQIIQFRRTGALEVSEQLARDREQRMASLISSAGNVGSGVTLSGTSQWSDYSNSDPIGDVTSGRVYMRNATNLVPNTGVMTDDIWNIVRRHPDLLEMYKYTEGGMITPGQLGAAFNLDRILIAGGVAERALENGTSSMTNIWPNNFILLHVAAGTGPRVKTPLVQFRWTNPMLGTPFALQTFRNDEGGGKHTAGVEARYYQDEKIIATELGYVIVAAVD